MSGPDPETRAVYDAGAAAYASRFAGEDTSPWLEAFMAGLPAGGAVLDLGCGVGRTAGLLRDAGFAVTATDAAAGMAAEARARYGIDVTIAGFEELDDIAAYDGVLAQFSLLHAPRADLPLHLSAIHRALRPHGHFVIGMKTGTGEARDRLGRRYAYVREDELAKLLEDAGFVISDTHRGAGRGFDGAIAPWIVVASQRG